jgi:carbon storage regulator
MPMLVLSRKLGEKIVIPQSQLSVTVIGIQGNSVRLGVSAPPEVAVHREELWREIHAEGSDVGETETTPDSLDELAAELSDAAYQIALRHGLADSWIDLELGLWRVLATKIRNRSRRIAPRLQLAEPHASNGHLARLPR